MRKMLALLCAVWIAVMPSIALAQTAATTGNDGNPTSTGGIRILGSDGTNDYKLLVDSSGRLVTAGPMPVMEVIAHRSNVILAAAGNDSSAVPFQTSAYRQMFIKLRIKAATFSSTGYLEVGVRGSDAAQADSTALGWVYALGTGTTHKGKTVRLTDLFDRWKMIPVTDSLTMTPFQSPYATFYLTNFTGAQVIYDLWYLGVR